MNEVFRKFANAMVQAEEMSEAELAELKTHFLELASEDMDVEGAAPSQSGGA